MSARRSSAGSSAAAGRSVPGRGRPRFRPGRGTARCSGREDFGLGHPVPRQFGLGQVNAAAGGVFVHVAEDVGQLKGPAQGLGVVGAAGVAAAEDADAQQAHGRRHAVAVQVQFRPVRVAGVLEVHLAAGQDFVEQLKGQLVGDQVGLEFAEDRQAGWVARQGAAEVLAPGGQGAAALGGGQGGVVSHIVHLATKGVERGHGAAPGRGNRTKASARFEALRRVMDWQSASLTGRRAAGLPGGAVAGRRSRRGWGCGRGGCAGGGGGGGGVRPRGSRPPLLRRHPAQGPAGVGVVPVVVVVPMAPMVAARLPPPEHQQEQQRAQGRADDQDGQRVPAESGHGHGGSAARDIGQGSQQRCQRVGVHASGAAVGAVSCTWSREILWCWRR
jgi:hypothetical protein